MLIALAAMCANGMNACARLLLAVCWLPQLLCIMTERDIKREKKYNWKCRTNYTCKFICRNINKCQFRLHFGWQTGESDYNENNKNGGGGGDVPILFRCDYNAIVYCYWADECNSTHSQTYLWIIWQFYWISHQLVVRERQMNWSQCTLSLSWQS